MSSAKIFVPATVVFAGSSHNRSMRRSKKIQTAIISNTANNRINSIVLVFDDMPEWLFNDRPPFWQKR